MILLDAIVGDTWDAWSTSSASCPPLLAGVGVTLVVDTLTTVPLFRDPAQAAQARAARDADDARPRAPAVAAGRAGGVDPAVARAAGGCSTASPSNASRCSPSTATATSRSRCHRRSRPGGAAGELVVVHGGSHSWLLKDPESLPAIMHRLMQGRLGTAVLKAVLAGGVDPNDATDDEIESIFYTPDSLAVRLTPAEGSMHDAEELHRRPRYEFSITMD